MDTQQVVKTFDAYVVEYIRPTRKKEVRAIALPFSLQDRYRAMANVGACLGHEKIGTNEYVFIENDEADFRSGIVPAEDLQATIVKFVEEFDIEKYQKWEKEMQGDGGE